MWPFWRKAARGSPGDPPIAGTGEESLSYEHYRVLEDERGAPWVLGHGAMGITYKAEDIHLRMPVALKVISPLVAESPGARELFLSEARGAASLRHRNAAAVHHLGVDRRGELFFAMEFIAGETVDTLIRRQQRLDVPLALDIAQQTACALAAAHQRGLIHRDLKPANLMLMDEGDGTLIVKVIDFGLCKSINTNASAAKPPGRHEPTGFVGTAHYASPEQIRADGQPDIRSDFYSLGATLWTMLAGRPVFDGSFSEVRRRHLEEEPPFENLPTAVSAPVCGLLASLLHKDPAGRPQTPLDLIDRIEGAAYAHRGEEADPRKHWKAQTCVPLLGSLLAHNYHLEALVDDGQQAASNPVFRAEDVRAQRLVAVQLLDRDQPLEQLRARMERLAATIHPNLVGNHALSSCRGQPFLVREWINGFSLEDVLRARAGALAPTEVRRLLAAAASAWEQIREQKLGMLNLSLPAVQIHFDGEPLERRQKKSLLAQPMAEWSEFSVKFDLEVSAANAPAPLANSEIVRRLGDFSAGLLGSQAMTDGCSNSQPGTGGIRLPDTVPTEAARVVRLALGCEPFYGGADQFIDALSLALSPTDEPKIS